jgi:hypothetical protein
MPKTDTASLQPVHEISAWTGNPEDETPICGADKNDPNVWGRRTVYTGYVTCDGCIAMRQSWEALNVPVCPYGICSNRQFDEPPCDDCQKAMGGR